ncbi:MAG: 1-phosphofructokinase [Lachnospiraceae bacterium]|nr:1-phosphofructokinase [Lachnospiraceae bacterium]
MIYTVTFNPSLDYVVEVADVKVGKLNRSQGEHVLPGGKGINVSHMLKNLGVDSVAMGFLGGFAGEKIERLVRESGCRTDFVYIDGDSRINVKIKSDNNPETEINATGPVLKSSHLLLLMERMKKIGEGDMLVLAGSIPKGIPDTVYADIMKELQDKNVQVIVDATGSLLLNTLQYHPFLIKPNKEELEELLGEPVQSEDDIVAGAKCLKILGATNVLVSMGGEGAILVDEHGQVHREKAPEGEVINAVGAGDSMVAGFIAGYNVAKDYEYAICFGVAAGSASAFSKGFATMDQVHNLLY